MRSATLGECNIKCDSGWERTGMKDLGGVCNIKRVSVIYSMIAGRKGQRSTRAEGNATLNVTVAEREQGWKAWLLKKRQRSTRTEGNAKLKTP